ncbi:hypothetical protein CONPUDRAFT_88776 [Coniophora puteana RWD-64-598 SS2]|uniref:Uncharacterized protein n=1 Tax=Coniophora puteana (strain RWD-64-598) TaxID=741705 RepID=A0A5M3MUA3_CONPW|nr:uncharacterized protein CONPUDRAFT_88776 [Coniophora puteana RWD-64-598 SS2]EIW82630.1 hypothetical protein CONPUDRAFT_88776 [Coniophora puteana RWD-64-598 SS2]
MNNADIGANVSMRFVSAHIVSGTSGSQSHDGCTLRTLFETMSTGVLLADVHLANRHFMAVP